MTCNERRCNHVERHPEPFEVPEGGDDEFLAGWERGKKFMQSQKGYVSTALHRSLDPFPRFRYVNIAVWDTAADFYAAFDHPEFVAMREATLFTHYPSLYQVIRT
jgi:heme-degrading monooxygenase HmoA